MDVIIDRFEGKFAIVEISEKVFADLPLDLVPDGAREGDVISIEINRGASEKRKKRIKDLMNKVFE